MTDLGTLQLGGYDLETATIHVPAVGVWFADCALVNAAALSGSLVLQIGDQALRCTVEPEHSGTFGERGVVRVLGGGGGWSNRLKSRAYSNDAGVKTKLIAADAAREAGEQLGDFAPGAERVGVQYVREAGPASRTIEDAARGAGWRVDYDGITRVGPRPAVKIGAHTLLNWNPRTLFAELVCDSISALQIGAVIPTSEVMPEAVTIQSLEIHISHTGLRVHAWCGERRATSLLDTMRALVSRLIDSKLLGSYHYRVVRMNGDRCDLQPVSAASGMPSLVTVAMWPGVSGVHARLTRGTEVEVRFLDGDRAKPIVGGFVGRGGPGAEPEGIDIGGSGGALAARQGDTVEVLLPPCIASGTISGVGAFTAVLTFPVAKTLGSITTGSAKEVRIK